jgi:hypothetical protein
MVSTPSVAFDGGRNDGMKLHTGYFADPFVLKTDDGYVAYGTCPERSDEHDDREFLTLTSTDLLTWRSHGGALERADPALGADYWAPEVAYADGRWWMYYSIGHDIVGHHIRVAAADHPLGPFTDLGSTSRPTNASLLIHTHSRTRTVAGTCSSLVMFSMRTGPALTWRLLRWRA